MSQVGAEILNNTSFLYLITNLNTHHAKNRDGQRSYRVDGQMNLEDFLPREKPSMHEPGIYSKSGRQRLNIERNGDGITVSIWTDSEAMIIRLGLEEFKEYVKNECGID